MSSRLPLVSRVLTALAAVLLLGTFAFPLWRIELEAPQYPEGIGMLIRIHTVDGIKPNDLQNINGLNHYIGMKAIEPDAIPELRFMPWIVGGLVAAGLAAALVGRRGALVAWLGALGVAGIAGLVDFWKWGYDYGHDLDPHAIIRIPDMAYQPPLIGSKQLLNFTAHSWPDLGGVLAGLACALAVVALVVAWRRERRVAVATVAGVLALAGCAPAVPRAIAYGREACAECRMVAGDPRFGAELVTAKGKLYVFDSIECLAAYTLARGGDARGRWVTDYEHPGTLVPVDSARFRRLAGPAGSPMGRGLAATRRGVNRAAEEMAWSDVLALLRDEGLAGGASHAH
ncbi:hypothetical protein [Roseisolibacter agri]|uniref:Copper chaperone NosL n=1 Tax=Roseisolibacter agri TaxID=2014610 RepID=A0AA37QG94_9BACT|nr:hypothetical protein [Roseisolibacter agri]GLC25238.1 hypothetical protein rosag_17510 [Roseisolibacter agri]